MATKTNTAKTNTAAARTDEKPVMFTSRNGHGIARSCHAIPAYKIDAMRRVAPAVYGD